MLNHKTLPTSGPLSYLHGSALKTWTSSWKKESSAGMDTWNTPTVQSRQPLTYRLLESVGLGGPRWLGSSWQRGIAESGSSQLSTLMIETPGNLVWDLPCEQQASYLEGSPMLRILPLYQNVNKKSDDDDDDEYLGVLNCLRWRLKTESSLKDCTSHCSSDKAEAQYGQITTYLLNQRWNLCASLSYTYFCMPECNGPWQQS